jgi:hypothetical protein
MRRHRGSTGLLACPSQDPKRNTPGALSYALSLLLLASTAAAQAPLVVVAAARTGQIQIFEAATLTPLGDFRVNQPVESVSASPDGRRLYIAQEEPAKPGDCCGLFTLDLETRNMCFLAAPALFGAPSPDGRFLFTQSGQGIDMFDARTLNRLPTMKAPGAYNLQPSPDGRWLLGITNSPQPSLDVFDMAASAMVRRLLIPAKPVTGAWVGDRFYLFSYGGGSSPGTGWLWSVRPEDTELVAARRVDLPDLHAGCNEPVLLMLAGARDRLFLAEAFGFKVDRRGACPNTPMGGIYAIQPSTGQVSRIAESVEVNRMVVTPDGRDLYVLEPGNPKSHSRTVRLLHIDALGNRERIGVPLPAGDWNLALAHIPAALIPSGRMRSYSNCSR